MISSNIRVRLFLALIFLARNVRMYSIVKRQVPNFHWHVAGQVTSHKITEASGLAASLKHPGALYTHNDHGGTSEIYVINALTGDKEATFTISGVTSNDWEDIALGKCHPAPDSDFCIYIGDFGNSGKGALNNIYRVTEPNDLSSQTIYVGSNDKLHFSWDSDDCETLMVDPSANLFIISKVSNGHGTIAQLPNSAWGSNSRVSLTSTAVVNIESGSNDPVGGDISPDGNEILVKTHHNIYYWNLHGTKDYMAMLQTPGTKIAYNDEPQGEAVCWDATGLGYYTLSEGQDQTLYHYIKS